VVRRGPRDGEPRPGPGLRRRRLSRRCLQDCTLQPLDPDPERPLFVGQAPPLGGPARPTRAVDRAVLAGLVHLARACPEGVGAPPKGVGPRRRGARLAPPPEPRGRPRRRRHGGRSRHGARLRRRGERSGAPTPTRSIASARSPRPSRPRRCSPCATRASSPSTTGSTPTSPRREAFGTLRETRAPSRSASSSRTCRACLASAASTTRAPTAT
jgi:hypothetical protein